MKINFTKIIERIKTVIKELFAFETENLYPNDCTSPHVEEEKTEYATKPEVEEEEEAEEPTVENVMIFFIEKLETEGGLKPSTIKTYWYYLKNYFGFIKAMPIGALMTMDIRASIEEDIRSGKSLNTLKKAYGFLKKVMVEYRPDIVDEWNSLPILKVTEINFNKE